jgi:hypothetical protein
MRRARPYRGENPEPGKDVHGELDPWPGIREQPEPAADVGDTSTLPKQRRRPCTTLAGCAALAVKFRNVAEIGLWKTGDSANEPA